MRFRSFLSLLAVPLLAGCQTLDNMMPDLSGVGIGQPAMQPAKTTGLAVSDEPFAAQAGAAILSQGGSATDAVAAMFFTLGVTYPVAAGLGGGGICIVRDASGRALEYDFLAHAPNAGGPFAVPGAVAGFHDMQKAFGILPWQRVIAPGEAYAGTGFPISHVLEQRLVPAAALIRNDPALASEFLLPNGQPKPEGTVVVNRALSVTMSAVRLGETDGFYAGPVAASIAASTAAIGGAISAGELHGFHATSTAARVVTLGGFSAAVPGPGTGAGNFTGRVISDTGRGNPDTAVVVAVRQALASFGVAHVPPDLGATSFAALDANGQAAACAITLNGPFGAARTAGDTGVVLAASPSQPTGISAAFLTPMIAYQTGGGVVLAGAGSGGPNGTAAILYPFFRLAAGQPVARPSDLRSTGLAPFVTANTIACQDQLCVALPDPGGSGLGAIAIQPVASN